MIINHKRREELLKFSEEFQLSLKEAEMKSRQSKDTFKQNGISISSPNPSTINKRNRNLINHNSPQIWKPINRRFECFDTFQRLPPGKDINEWEIQRVNLVERSYEKEKSNHWTPASRKEFFGEPKDLNGLSKLGKKIISGFIEQNKKKETEKIKQAEYYEKVKYTSKEKNQLNIWKNPGKKDYFSDIEPLNLHLVKEIKENNQEFMQKPFKRPRAVCDFFDKEIRIL